MYFALELLLTDYIQCSLLTYVNLHIVRFNNGFRAAENGFPHPGLWQTRNSSSMDCLRTGRSQLAIDANCIVLRQATRCHYYNINFSDWNNLECDCKVV